MNVSDPPTIPFSLPTDSSNATHDAAHLTFMNAQTTPQQRAQPQQDTAKTAEAAMRNKNDQHTEGRGCKRDATPPGMAPASLYDAADHPHSHLHRKC